jgi:hypothetical protein
VSGGKKKVIRGRKEQEGERNRREKGTGGSK